MAAPNASTSSTLLSPGGFALRCLPTTVATSCRSWGSVTRRLRSTGGLVEVFNRRFNTLANELDACKHNVGVRNGKEARLGLHRNVPYEFLITLSR